jgi:anti-sigma factor RsiW
MSVRRSVEHLRLRRHLDAYIDGEIVDRALSVRVGTHIARCPMCRAAARSTMLVKYRLASGRYRPGSGQGYSSTEGP